MNDTLTWSHFRTETVELFNGELPRAETEAAIINVFEITPAAVIKARDRIAIALTQGKVRSAWAVLKAELQGAADPVREATVSRPTDRANATRLAETWVKNAGLHFDSADAIVEELFKSQQGRLHPWATDDALQRNIINLWLEQRPAGIKVEQDAEARADAYRKRRALPKVDKQTGHALVARLVADKVPIEMIERVLNRAVPDATLRAELVDHAANLNDDIAFA